MAHRPSHARSLLSTPYVQPDLAAAVLELPFVIIVVVDAAGAIVAASQAACNAAGYTANKLIGQPLRRLQSTRQDPALLERVLEDLAEGDVWEGPLWWASRDGQQREQWLSVRRLPEGAGGRHYLISGLDMGTPAALLRARDGAATVDALTRLPGRTVFEDRLAQALKQARRRDTILAVMKLELDQLSDINTLLGNALGDQVLCEVAALLNRILRDGDTVARTGASEFGLILPDLEDYESAAQVAQKIQKALGVPLVLHEREMHLVSNIGISLYPKDGNEAPLLIRHADSALTNLREEERGGYRFFAKSMNARALERMMLHNSILGGLLREEFLLHYQPQVAFESRQIIGLEALVRWQHPDLGLVPPVKFISIAEQTGTIVPLGEWVLRKACAQCMAWRQLGGKAVRIAVNISVRQLRSGGFVRMLEQILAETGLPPSCLELELTESMLMESPEAAARILHQLRKLGVRISLDDFGTGYSSLSYLQQFQIDTLKVDRSFIRKIYSDPRSEAIISALINLSHSLGVQVLAEGVETADQWRFLQENGCDLMQGYLVSPPLPPEDLLLDGMIALPAGVPPDSNPG